MTIFPLCEKTCRPAESVREGVCRVSLIRQTAVGFIYQFLTLVCDGSVARQRTTSKVRQQKRGALAYATGGVIYCSKHPWGGKDYGGDSCLHTGKSCSSRLSNRGE